MDLVVTIVRKREITLRPGNHRNLSKGNGSRRYFFFFFTVQGLLCTPTGIYVQVYTNE